MKDQAREWGSEVEMLGPWKRARLTVQLLRDEHVPLWTKAAVPAIALAYLVLPIDLIPDVILGLGQLDDLSVIGIAMFAMTRVLPKLAPRERVQAHLAGMRGEGANQTRQPEGDDRVIETRYVVNDVRPGDSGARSGTGRPRGE